MHSNFLVNIQFKKDIFNNWIQHNMEVSLSSNSSINNGGNLSNICKKQNKDNIQSNNNEEVKRNKTKPHIEKRELKKIYGLHKKYV